MTYLVNGLLQTRSPLKRSQLLQLAQQLKVEQRMAEYVGIRKDYAAKGLAHTVLHGKPKGISLGCYLSM